MKPKSRKELINSKAFRAGTAAYRLRLAVDRLNDALIEASQTGVEIDLKVLNGLGCDYPLYSRIEGTMKRGKRGKPVPIEREEKI